MESAKQFTDGWLVWYNYLRPHESLADKTPAERAGVKFPYSNWQDIISDSSIKAEPVKWTEKQPAFLKTKEPNLGMKIPKNVQKMIGMRRM